MYFEFQSISCVLFTLGAKTLKIFIKYPALLLTPVFTNWTFGSPKPFSCKDQNQLKMSWTFTWGNLILTSVLGSIIVTCILGDRIGKEFDPTPATTDTKFFFMFYFPIFLPIVTYATLLLLQLLPKCDKYCCNCCQNNCFPMIEESILSMETLSTNKENETELEMENQSSIQNHITNIRDNYQNHNDCILLSYHVREIE